MDIHNIISFEGFNEMRTGREFLTYTRVTGLRKKASATLFMLQGGGGYIKSLKNLSRGSS